MNDQAEAPTKLHQIIAVEKGTKSRVYAYLSEVYKAFQKPALFNGHARTYTRKNEDGEDFPPENVRVQMVASVILKEIAKQMAEYLDLVAAKDWANCTAKADVVVAGRVLVKDAPASYLLFLEKQLSDLKDELSKIPELDPSQEWAKDPNSDLFKADPKQTTKTAKEPKVITKAEATKEHPAQTELIYLDRAVGTWTHVAHSGALPTPRKRELQERLTKLIKAVKYARQQANEQEAPEKKVGDTIFDYLFA